LCSKITVRRVLADTTAKDCVSLGEGQEKLPKSRISRVTPPASRGTRKKSLSCGEGGSAEENSWDSFHLQRGRKTQIRVLSGGTCTVKRPEEIRDKFLASNWPDQAYLGGEPIYPPCPVPGSGRDHRESIFSRGRKKAERKQNRRNATMSGAKKNDLKTEGLSSQEGEEEQRRGTQKKGFVERKEGLAVSWKSS